MKALRIIIAGGRDFDNYKLLRSKTLKVINQVIRDINHTDSIPSQLITIISGTANGADQQGELFAKEFHLELKRMPAQWEEYGKSAGYMRNTQMANFACLDENAQGILIAFWDGKSRGTKHMIDIAKKKNMLIYTFDYAGNAHNI